MKKFTAVLAVLALTLMASVAMAEVSLSGSIDIRSLQLNNTADFTSKAGDRSNTTQERLRFNVDAKSDNVKGRITFENDWEVWGTQTNAAAGGTTAAIAGATPAGSGVETRPGSKFGFREAWMDFGIPGASPAHVKVGHQFLQLGNGWFFRSGKYGSDAWLVGLPGKNTVAFVDVKVKEGLTTQADDVDAYVLLDNFKITDNQTVGVYWARVNDRRNQVGGAFGLGAAGTDTVLDNIGFWYNGKLGPVNLQGELDFQMGKAKGDGTAASPDDKFKGAQVIVQANVALDKFTINGTLAQGTGQKTPATAGGAVADEKMYISVLDADPHYTVVYEYFAKTACAPGGTLSAGGLKNTGFCNTTAINIGGSVAPTKWLTASLDFWMLKATEKVWNVAGVQTDEIGNELDLVLKFKLSDQLTWNWQIARLMAGKMYDPSATRTADDIDAIQGILSYKF